MSFKRKIATNTLNAFFIALLILSSTSIYKSLAHKHNVNKAISNATVNKLASNEDIEILEEDYRQYIKTEGNISNELISYLNTKLNLIPKSILSKYFGNNGIILLTDKDIAKTYYSNPNIGRIVGLHNARKNIVYISNSKYAINYALIHEFGHVLDSLTEWKSMQEEFNNIYIKEKETLEVHSVDGHYKTNQREFFAEVFQQYVIANESCKNTAPKAYNFIHQMIEEVKYSI